MSLIKDKEKKGQIYLYIPIKPITVSLAQSIKFTKHISTAFSDLDFFLRARLSDSFSLAVLSSIALQARWTFCSKPIIALLHLYTWTRSMSFSFYPSAQFARRWLRCLICMPKLSRLDHFFTEPRYIRLFLILDTFSYSNSPLCSFLFFPYPIEPFSDFILSFTSSRFAPQFPLHFSLKFLHSSLAYRFPSSIFSVFSSLFTHFLSHIFVTQLTILFFSTTYNFISFYTTYAILCSLHATFLMGPIFFIAFTTLSST